MLILLLKMFHNIWLEGRAGVKYELLVTVTGPSVLLVCGDVKLKSDLDIGESGKLAICQSLDDHQWRHQLVFINVPQNL